MKTNNWFALQVIWLVSIWREHFSCLKSATNLCVQFKYGKLVTFYTFYTPLKTSDNLRSSDISRGYKKGTLSWNGLNIKTDCSNESHRQFCYKVEADFLNIKVSRKGGVIIQTVGNNTKSNFSLKRCLSLIYYKVGINTNEFIYKTYNDNSKNYLYYKNWINAKTLNMEEI